MMPSAHPGRASIFGIGIDAVDMPQALACVRDAIESGRRGYVCLVGVHGVMEAQRLPALADAYAQATLCLPDGMPTVWMARAQGFASIDRVAGPDLMLAVLDGELFRHRTHFLYGGKPGVAEDLERTLTARFPGLRIAGRYTPPFRELSPEEERELAAMVARLKPDFFWVGISTPRQERFMRTHVGRLDTRLMLGVGAAFDFHTGRIHDAPRWMKRAGLQWLHRLAQDPRRLFWRYARNNTAFLWKVMVQLVACRTT